MGCNRWNSIQPLSISTKGKAVFSMNFINGLQKCAISKDTQNKIPMIADTPSKMTEKKISKNHQMKSYQIKLTIFSNYI